jgi:hypothetical protein
MIGGTKGSIQFPNLKYWFYKNERSWWNKILVNEDKNKKDDSTLVNQIDHFADVVLKKVKPKVNGNDGLISLKIFAAITKVLNQVKKLNFNFLFFSFGTNKQYSKYNYSNYPINFINIKWDTKYYKINYRRPH